MTHGVVQRGHSQGTWTNRSPPPAGVGTATLMAERQPMFRSFQMCMFFGPEIQFLGVYPKVLVGRVPKDLTVRELGAMLIKACKLGVACRSSRQDWLTQKGRVRAGKRCSHSECGCCKVSAAMESCSCSVQRAG